MRQYHFYKDEQLLTRLKVFNVIGMILLLIITMFLARYYGHYLEYFLVFLCGALANIVFSCVIYLFMKKGLA